MNMINTAQQISPYNFPNISGLVDNGKSLLSEVSISTRKQISSSFEATFTDFNYTFNFEIISQSLEDNNVIFYLKLFDIVDIKVTLTGYWTKQKNPNFSVRTFNIEVEKNYETPISVFLLSTFWAMLNLSKSVKFNIPDSNYSLSSNFNHSLNKISDFLQDRQISYRLMVIEKALKVSLPLPNGFISGIDIENIAFCYHAIIKREFDWVFSKTLTFFPNSTLDNSDLLPATNSAFPLTFPTKEEIRVIFGHSLNLRQLCIEIDQAIVVNYEEAKQKMIALTGEPVEIIVKSANGKMRYKSINVPALPQNAFNNEIQNLIDLEEKLNSVYFETYLNSFSNAFEGLSEEEIQAVTERPSLDEEAFNF